MAGEARINNGVGYSFDGAVLVDPELAATVSELGTILSVAVDM